MPRAPEPTACFARTTAETSGSTSAGNRAVARRQPDGSYTVENAAVPALLRDSRRRIIYPDDDGVVWFGGRDGLIRYDPAPPQGATPPTSPRSSAGSSSTAASCRFAAVRGPPARPPSSSTRTTPSRFEFAAPSFDDESANQFQYMLEGLDPGWSAWTKEDNRDFTNLGFGSYRFRVRARNVYGQVSGEAVYAFTVLPPWYRTWWAYGLYLALLAAGIFAVDRIQRRRLIGRGAGTVASRASRSSAPRRPRRWRVRSASARRTSSC